MLAAFIFLPARPLSLSCFYSGSYFFFPLVKTVLITKQLILQAFSVTFSWVHECECFRKRKQHRFFFFNWKMKWLLGGSMNLWIREGMNNCLSWEMNCFYLLQYGDVCFLGCLLLLLAAPVKCVTFSFGGWSSYWFCNSATQWHMWILPKLLKCSDFLK